MDRTIIAAARGEDAHDAVALATLLGRIYDASVLIAGVFVGPLEARTFAAESAARAALQRELDALSADMPADVAYDVVMCEGSPARALEDLATTTGALALTLGPPRRDGIARAAHRDVAADLLHEAPCALALAPRGTAATLRYPPAVVGVAWDEAPEADAALRAAGDLAHRTGARLRLLHVAARLTRGDGALETALARRAQALGADPAPEIVLLAGDPATALVAAAADVDLLVAGSRAQGALRRAVLGSVSRTLAQRVACPLLVLPRGAEIVAAGA